MASKCPTTGKTSWPELVGVNSEYALIVIPQENPDVGYVQIVAAGEASGGDVDCRRVKVKVDQDGIVVEAPTIG